MPSTEGVSEIRPTDFLGYRTTVHTDPGPRPTLLVIYRQRCDPFPPADAGEAFLEIGVPGFRQEIQRLLHGPVSGVQQVFEPSGEDGVDSIFKGQLVPPLHLAGGEGAEMEAEAQEGSQNQ